MAESGSPATTSRRWVSKYTKASSWSENCCDFNPHFLCMMQNLPLFYAGCPGSLRIRIWLRNVKVRSRSCSQPQSPIWKKSFKLTMQSWVRYLKTTLKLNALAHSPSWAYSHSHVLNKRQCLPIVQLGKKKRVSYFYLCISLMFKWWVKAADSTWGISPHFHSLSIPGAPTLGQASFPLSWPSYCSSLSSFPLPTYPTCWYDLPAQLARSGQSSAPTITSLFPLKYV